MSKPLVEYIDNATDEEGYPILGYITYHHDGSPLKLPLYEELPPIAVEGKLVVLKPPFDAAEPDSYIWIQDSWSNLGPLWGS